MSSSPLPSPHCTRLSRISGLVQAILPAPSDSATEALETRVSSCQQVFIAWSEELRNALEEVERNVKEITDEEEACRVEWKAFEKQAENIVEKVEMQLIAIESREQVSLT